MHEPCRCKHRTNHIVADAATAAGISPTYSSHSCEVLRACGIKSRLMEWHGFGRSVAGQWSYLMA